MLRLKTWTLKKTIKLVYERPIHWETVRGQLLHLPEQRQRHAQPRYPIRLIQIQNQIQSHRNRTQNQILTQFLLRQGQRQGQNQIQIQIPSQSLSLLKRSLLRQCI